MAEFDTQQVAVMALIDMNGNTRVRRYIPKDAAAESLRYLADALEAKEET